MTFFSLLALFSGLAVILFPRALYSALALCVCLFSLAALFYFMGAHFAALIQLLVYVGAIMTLFVFVIMLVAHGKEEVKIFPDVVLVAFVLVVTLLFSLMPFLSHVPDLPQLASWRQLAEVLYKTYLVPFEVISVTFLVSIVAVVFFTRLR